MTKLEKIGTVVGILAGGIVIWDYLRRRKGEAPVTAVAAGGKPTSNTFAAVEPPPAQSSTNGSGVVTTPVGDVARSVRDQLSRFAGEVF